MLELGKDTGCTSTKNQHVYDVTSTSTLLNITKARSARATYKRQNF
jgi:hypothetical protein